MAHRKLVVVFSSGFPPGYKAGGPIRTMESLVRTAPDNFSLRVVTANKDLGETKNLPVISNCWVPWENSCVFYLNANSLIQYFRLMIQIRCMEPNILYINSLFDLKFSIIPRLLAGVHFFGSAKILLAPRGEFGAGALKLKSRKKRLFMSLYRTIQLDRGIIWHASSLLEKKDIVNNFPKSTKFLIKEDDSNLPKEAIVPIRTSDRLKIVFYSRISPIKGLDIILEGLTNYSESSPQINLSIYGPEEDKIYLSRCKTLISRLPSNIVVTFYGAIAHEKARSVLNKFDFMVLPTHGENFGHVIAESLSSSTPVITTDATPWTPILMSGGGIIISENTPNAWYEQIKRLSVMSPERKDQLRSNAEKAYSRWVETRDAEHVLQKFEEFL